MDQLTCSFSELGDVMLVSARGHIDAANAPRLHDALFLADAEQPATVVVDLGRLEVASPRSLVALLPPADDGDVWYPPRLVCAPTAEVREALHATPRTARLPVYPSVTEALRAADTMGLPARRLVRHLDSTPDAPGLAREFVSQACLLWRMSDLVAAGQLIVSELCANVVVHVASPMTVVLIRTPQSLHLAVRDRSDAPPVLGPPLAVNDAIDGRGLQLVDRLATHWGYATALAGKAVWAELRRS